MSEQIGKNPEISLSEALKVKSLQHSLAKHAIDEIAGILYAILAYLASPYILSFIQKVWHDTRLKILVLLKKHAKVKAL